MKVEILGNGSYTEEQYTVKVDGKRVEAEVVLIQGDSPTIILDLPDDNTPRQVKIHLRWTELGRPPELLSSTASDTSVTHLYNPRFLADELQIAAWLLPEGATNESAFSAMFAALIREVDTLNREKGWHDQSRTFGDECALLTSEVMEMFEEFRAGRLGRFGSSASGYWKISDGEDYPDYGKPEGVPSEAADIFIRLLDFCARYNIDLFAEYRAKMGYNRTRPHKHGGKQL